MPVTTKAILHYSHNLPSEHPNNPLSSHERPKQNAIGHLFGNTRNQPVETPKSFRSRKGRNIEKAKIEPAIAVNILNVILINLTYPQKTAELQSLIKLIDPEN